MPCDPAANVPRYPREPKNRQDQHGRPCPRLRDRLSPQQHGCGTSRRRENHHHHPQNHSRSVQRRPRPVRSRSAMFNPIMRGSQASASRTMPRRNPRISAHRQTGGLPRAGFRDRHPLSPGRSALPAFGVGRVDHRQDARPHRRGEVGPCRCEPGEVGVIEQAWGGRF